MASIIKNQILKHLSKFTKNLSQDKINLSTFKGEGELSNLELDEVILMDLLDLPTWMKLSKAVCNRLSIKIQWTKLKSKPICIYLDEVVLEVETCDPPRPPNNPAHMASYRTVGKYGFIDRVIDGIYVHINSVSAKFISRKFHATLQLSRVKVHSVTPIWKPSDELGSTKIRDSERGEILLFKEVDWQTTRIEATAVEGESSKEFVTTPLRFIANQSKIRITIKKKLSDCSIIATRVMLLLDDLLWVLTDTQLKAAIHYITSLRDLIDKSRQQSKNLAAEKLHIQGQSSQYADLQQQHSQRPRSQTNSSISSMFTKFDVSTTSYHVISSRIDLHLCDDSIPNSVKIPKHNNLIEGGAMQISFFKLSLDIYPFNPAGGERKSWHRYMDNQGSRNYWVQQLFAAFKQEVSKARNTCKIVSPSQSPSHTVASLKKSEAMQNEAKHAPPSPRQGRQHDAPHTRRSTKLLESCYVLKIEEFTIFQVTTADNKRNSPKKFLSSDKKQLHLPSDMSVIHAEYTDYFFPEGIDFPVPHANLYVLLNPVCVNVDWLTMLWMNYFMLNLAQSLGNIEIEDTSLPHLDMKVEAIMPRVIVPGEEKMDSNPERPEGIQLQISKISATNTHVEDNTTSKELSSVIDSYSKASLFTSNQFPNENNPLSAIPPNFSSHAQGTENPYLDKLAKCLVDGKVQDVVIGERKDILKTKTLTKDASYDIWVVITEQVWLEFLGSISSKCRPSPFVESIPITLWLCKSSSEVKPTKRGSQDKTKSDSMSCKDIKVENDNEQKYVETENDPDQNSPERQNRRAHKLLKEFYVVENSSEDVPVGNSLEESTREHLQDSDELHQRSHREAYCDKLRFSAKGSSCDPAGNVQYSACHAASFNLLAKIGPGRIKAQMTHFQYIMTMGLLESFTKFQEQMNADVTYFLGDSSPPLTFSVPLVVPEIEIAMICPYTAELPPFDSPFSPSAISAHDDDMEDESQDKCISNYSNEKEDSEDATLTDDKQSSSTTVDCLYTISKSQSDSGIHSHLPTSNDVIGLGDQDMDKNVLARNSLSSQTLSSVESVNLSQGLVSFSAMASESGYSSTSSSRSRNQQMAGGKSGSKATDHMKKFTSKMSGLADKLKAKIDSKGDDGISDDSETMSIRTDLSDEDTDFEMLSLDDGDSPIFQHHRTSETASISTDTDAMEDFSSFFADNSSKAQDMVSVILFKLYHGEVCLQGDGNKVSARIQAKSLLTSQPGNMLYEDFHAKFDSQSGFLQAEDGPFGNSYAVKMKFTGPSTETEDEKDSEGKGFLQVKAQDCGLRFTLSSLTNLTNFVEDESVGEALPMHIDVNNFSLILQEDRPSSDTTVGGPVAVPEPIQLSIHQLTITRGGDGIFHLRGGGLEPMDTLICNADPEIIQTAENNIEEVPTKGDNFDKVNSTQEISTNKIKSKLVTALTELQQAKQQKQLSDMKAMVSQTKLETAVTELQQIKQEKQKLQEMINDMNSKLEQLENLKFENRSLQEQMKKFAYSSPNELEEARDLKTQNEMYITENLKLIEKVSHLEDEVISLNREKTSLVDTLKLLQDELNFSERRRHNSTSDSK